MGTLNEAHGTGTALGDPIEVGSLVSVAVQPRCGVATEPLAVGGIKANIGHAEPAAGMTGLLKLALGLSASQAAPNAQLRALNPKAYGQWCKSGGMQLRVQLGWGPPSARQHASGGVSSFA